MAIVKNEDVSSGEFEKRIGNLDGIEYNFRPGTILQLFLTGENLTAVQLDNNDPNLIDDREIGVDLETALVNLNKRCNGQEVIPPEHFTGIKITTKENNIDRWLENGGIHIYGERTGRFVEFESVNLNHYLGSKGIYGHSLTIKVGMGHGSIANILTSVNSEIIPALFEFIPETLQATL
jgi:hypothetical protein